jgi:hypothetical protein
MMDMDTTSMAFSEPMKKPPLRKSVRSEIEVLTKTPRMAEL